MEKLPEKLEITDLKLLGRNDLICEIIRRYNMHEQLLEACKDILAYFDQKENDILANTTAGIMPQWDVDYVRNTLEDAITAAEKEGEK